MAWEEVSVILKAEHFGRDRLEAEKQQKMGQSGGQCAAGAGRGVHQRSGGSGGGAGELFFRKTGATREWRRAGEADRAGDVYGAAHRRRVGDEPFRRRRVETAESIPGFPGHGGRPAADLGPGRGRSHDEGAAGDGYIAKEHGEGAEGFERPGGEGAV